MRGVCAGAEDGLSALLALAPPHVQWVTLQALWFTLGHQMLLHMQHHSDEHVLTYQEAATRHVPVAGLLSRHGTIS